MWSQADKCDVVEIATRALEARERELHDEQAVYGLDSFDELDLHPLFARAFAEAGMGSLREQPYPHEWTTRKRGKNARASVAEVEDVGIAPSPVLVKVNATDAFPESRPGAIESAALPLPRERLRCDLVLTREPGVALGDAVVQERERRARKSEVAGTLFEAMARKLTPADTGERLAGLGVAPLIAPEDAFWIEVKSLAQFDLSSGVPGFNRSYASALVRAMAGDLRKLTDDSRVRYGASLLVLFTHDRATADHDLPIALHTCLDRGLNLWPPEIRRFAIDDRLGNAVCTICLTAIRR